MTEPTNTNDKKELVLSDGRKVELNLNGISISEYREMLKKDQTDEEEYAAIAKLTGIQDVKNIGFDDYRKIIAAFFEKLKEPVNPT